MWTFALREIPSEHRVTAATSRVETVRWGALAFSHCDVSRELDSATALCQPRSAGGAPDHETDQVWSFSLRKADGGWKIASVQPPANKEQ